MNSRFERPPRAGRNPAHPIPPLRSRGTGFAVEGPGFYVWDEVESETRRSAAELMEVAPAGER